MRDLIQDWISKQTKRKKGGICLVGWDDEIKFKVRNK